MIKHSVILDTILRTHSNTKMKIEVNSAADFLISLLRVRQKVPLSENQLQSFRGNIADVLMQQYQRHWYPELPAKGSGYRCIRINGKMDPLIEQAGMAAGLNSRTLRKMLPQELTMWIDPDEVSYRIGENGSVCVLYDSRRASPLSDLDSTGSDEFIMERVGRIEISNDLKELLLYEADSTFITRPRSHRRNYNRNNHHKHNIYHSNHIQLSQQNSQLNNSISSASSGHLSPPSSPTNSNNIHNNQQSQLNNNNFSSPQKQLFNNPTWDSYNNHSANTTNTRAAC